ncbi:MAG: efflux RND transporter periplasmic adaptor subunit [Chlorobium sp.]
MNSATMTIARSIAERLKKNRLLSVVLLMLLFVALFLAVQYRGPEKKQKIKFYSTIPVSVDRVSKMAVRDSFSTVGTVEAFSEAEIFSESAGLVRTVLAEPGAQKKAGETLFVIDDELSLARQKRAEAEYRQAKKDFERYSNLYREGAVALSAFETVQLKLDQAEAEFTLARRKYRDTRITAPFAGSVTARFVEKGEMVHEGMKVAHLVDMRRVKIVIFVPEREITKFLPGVDLVVTSDLFPAERFSGKVSSVSDKAGRDHTFRVEVALQNPGKNAFRSGMFARVLHTGDGKREALLVPRTALVSGIRKPELFVVRHGKAFLRPLVTGMELQNYLEVIDGIAAGDSVVVSGQNELQDGAAVSVISQKKSPSAQ